MSNEEITYENGAKVYRNAGGDPVIDLSDYNKEWWEKREPFICNYCGDRHDPKFAWCKTECNSCWGKRWQDKK